MTKAERIYKETRYQTRKYIKTWGYDVKVAFGNWHTETNERPDGEVIYRRTQNELLRMLQSERKELTICKKLNIGTEEELILKEQVLDMMERTAKNAYVVE